MQTLQKIVVLNSSKGYVRWWSLVLKLFGWSAIRTFLFVCSSFCLDFVSYLLVSVMEFVGEGVGGNFKFEDFWIFFSLGGDQFRRNLVHVCICIFGIPNLKFVFDLEVC